MRTQREFRRIFRLSRAERDIDDEIAFHLDSRIRDLMLRGMTSDAARALALREFGNVDGARLELAEGARRRLRRLGARERLVGFVQDVRYTARGLIAARGLALGVIVLFALGVGANAAVFSVANELFLRSPSGVGTPSSVVRLYLSDRGPATRMSLQTNGTAGGIPSVRSNFFYPSFSAIAGALTPLASTAAYIYPDSASAQVGAERFTIFASYVTPNYLSLLGVPLAVGRSFNPHDDPVKADASIAVISYALWQSRFAGDPDVLGRSMAVTNKNYTIVGVAASGFSGIDLDRADVWLPLADFPWMPLRVPWYSNWRGQLNTRIIARPRTGVAASTLASVATTATRRGEIENLGPLGDSTSVILTGPLLESLGPASASSVQSAITTRLIGVALILFIVSCANVANLLLLRGERRRREVALRLALGISRRRLVMQLLLESMMLSFAAAAVAVIVGAWAGTLLRRALMPSVHWATSAVDGRVALVCTLLACSAGLGTAVAPAIRTLHTNLADVLKSSVGAGGTRSRLRTALMVAQAALSVVLLVGAGLFLRSLDAVRSTDLGYDLARVAFGQIAFRDPSGRYIDFLSHRHDEELSRGLSDVATRLRNTSNIEDAALATAAPMGGYAPTEIFFSDRRPTPRLANRAAALFSVTPNYASATGLRLVRGRWLRDDDRVGSAAVVVINEATARAFWPDRDPIGQCLVFMDPAASCSTVVGIIRDAHLADYLEPPVVEAFVAMAQQTGRFLRQPNTVIVRARAGRLPQAVADLRGALARTFPNAEPPYVRTMEDAREPELRPWRLGAELFGLFGCLALIVATLGVYSAIAYAVSQRTRELGVRIALGAPRGRIVASVARLGALPLLVGISCGIGLSLALSKFVASMLYGTTIGDPLTLVTVCLVLFAAGVVGMLAPLHRAIHVDPVRALRLE